MDPRLSTRHGFTHINAHFSLSHTHTQTGDAQTLGCGISVMSKSKLLRSQAEMLSCSIMLSLFLIPALLLLSPLSLCSLCVSFLSFLIPPSSLLPPFLCLSPPLSSVGAASHRDRLKQMPSWETGYVCV